LPLTLTLHHITIRKRTMTERSVLHNTFVIERDFAASPEKIFSLYSTLEKKVLWFGSPDYPATEWTMDFREGGKELNSGEFHGYLSTYDALYLDIVENSRIVLSYNMYVDGVKLSSSLQTTQLEATPTGTRVVLTETGAYFDGHEDPVLREQGTNGLIDALKAIAES
jgi:uncharacterized protein YndB with AHSA1/START domain